MSPKPASAKVEAPKAEVPKAEPTAEPATQSAPEAAQEQPQPAPQAQADADAPAAGAQAAEAAAKAAASAGAAASALLERASGLLAQAKAALPLGLLSSMDQQQVFFSINCATLLSVLLYVLSPLTGRALGARAYYWAFLSGAMAFGASLYLQAKTPAAWTADAIKAWLPSVLGTNNFSYLWYCTIFMGSPPMLMALTPLAICAAYNGMTYAQRRLTHLPMWSSYGARAAAFLNANTQNALQLNATVEVMLLFTLVLQVFTMGFRRAMAVGVYLNLLRMRYHCRDGNIGFYHRNVWLQIGAKVMPYVARVPQLEGPLAQATAWFTR